MIRRLVRTFAVVAALAMLAAACGSDRAANTADPTAVPDAEPSPSDTDAGAGQDGDDTQDEDGNGGEEPTPDASEAPPEMFGDIAWPCGPGDASGATDQGVTDESIVIGGGDDRGSPQSPGLNKAQTDAIAALVAKCNELGGINGRQLEVVLYDAELFSVGTVMLEACDTVFMLVGEGFAVDQFGEETRVQCDLAHIPAWTVSAGAAHGPGMVQPLPNPADRLPVMDAAVVAELFPDTIGDSAVMWGDFSATIETKDKVVAAWPDLGYEFTELLEYSVNGEDDWTPFVLALKESGVKHVNFIGSCLPNYQAFRATAERNEFEAVYTANTNFYEAACVEANADGVMNDTYMRVSFFPFEDRDVVPAIDDYVTLVESSGGEISALGMQTTSAFFLWATAASACGSELTRQCVLEQAEAIDEWTGGGLHVATDPGVNEPPECGIILAFQDDEYVRVRPEAPGEVICDDAYVAGFSTEWVEDANLDENRVSQKFTG